ncbi:MAG: hypothetical protein HFH59_09265 [Lachnospiraceae bacterium]|nr:hypothetical protein [Lachnospiraceae bacterium]
MSPKEAAGVLKEAVDQEKKNITNQANARLPRAANALMNAERDVLSGNASPSPAGSPPGSRTGNLARNWTPACQGGGVSMLVSIIGGMYYAGYLEEGTRKMAARPFVEKIKQAALPGVAAIFSEIGG